MTDGRAVSLITARKHLGVVIISGSKTAQAVAPGQLYQKTVVTRIQHGIKKESGDLCATGKSPMNQINDQQPPTAINRRMRAKLIFIPGAGAAGASPMEMVDVVHEK